MNAKRKSTAKSPLKTTAKVIYIFEYMNEANRSSLFSFGVSNNYVPVPSFDNLKVNNKDQKLHVEFLYNKNGGFIQRVCFL